MVQQSHTAGWLPGLYEPIRTFGKSVADWFAPRSDASALEKGYEINIELPGLTGEDVDISVSDNSLIVAGEKSSQHEEGDRTYFFSEREFGAFQRTFRLPPDADLDRIDATFDDGVLKIYIGKMAKSDPEARKVTISRSKS